MERETGPAQPRPVFDRVVLIVVVVCLGIALLRVAAVAATLPYALYTSRRAAAQAAINPTTTPLPTVVSRFEHSATVHSWWGGRKLPYPGGGDYFDVASHHNPARSIAIIEGLVAEQDRKQGIAFDQIIVPKDRTLLYGEDAGLLVVNADGEMARTSWGKLADDTALVSSVKVVNKAYDPVLTPEQSARLTATGGLTEPSRAFFVGAPKAGGSGVWVLLARVAPLSREFLLVPIESSPLGGAQ